MNSGNVYCFGGHGQVQLLRSSPMISFFCYTKSFLTSCIFTALLIYYFTSVSSRRNKKVYAANSMLKSSKMSMDC